MEIQIKKILSKNLRYKYEILNLGSPLYYAKSILFSINSTINIIDSFNNLIGRVKKNDSTDLDYEISIDNYPLIVLKSHSFTHFEMYAPKGNIHFYLQDGKKCGLFFENNQVGIIEKVQKTILGQCEYSLLIDRNKINPLFAISFTLAFDDFFKEKAISIINTDIGSIIIKPEKLIDTTWIPRDLTI